MTTPSIKFAKDPMAALTHFLGVVAAVIGFFFLVAQAGGDTGRLIGAVTYGLSLIALFSASTTYHFFDLGERGNGWLRRLDHSAIYLLIAGTYVPALIHLLDGAWRISMLTIIVGLALAGVLFKLVWFDTAKNAGTILYVAMGWLVVLPAYKMYPVMSATQVGLIAAGGVAYTVGAAVYATKWPDPWPEHFGFHEVWHVFVLAGAGSHFFFVHSLLGTGYAAFG